ncbi:MAG: hypothetical protein LBJ82_01660 [Deltaproteobacteria bacterium]|nr:hypothetical protein [Deltaproteobacteria bacterium]
MTNLIFTKPFQRGHVFSFALPMIMRLARISRGRFRHVVKLSQEPERLQFYETTIPLPV